MLIDGHLFITRIHTFVWISLHISALASKLCCNAKPIIKSRFSKLQTKSQITKYRLISKENTAKQIKAKIVRTRLKNFQKKSFKTTKNYRATVNALSDKAKVAKLHEKKGKINWEKQHTRKLLRNRPVGKNQHKNWVQKSMPAHADCQRRCAGWDWL